MLTWQQYEIKSCQFVCILLLHEAANSIIFDFRKVKRACEHKGKKTGTKAIPRLKLPLQKRGKEKIMCMILCDKLQWEKCVFAQCYTSSCVSEQTSESLAAYLHQHWDAVWHTRLVQIPITSLYAPLKCRTNNTCLCCLYFVSCPMIKHFWYCRVSALVPVVGWQQKFMERKKKTHLNKAHAILQKIFLCHLCIERKTVTHTTCGSFLYIYSAPDV